MLKLSDSALGAVMLALQKSLMEQTDIVPVLKGFEFEIDSTDVHLAKKSTIFITLCRKKLRIVHIVTPRQQ